jgi:hypothetical protein
MKLIKCNNKLMLHYFTENSNSWSRVILTTVHPCINILVNVSAIHLHLIRGFHLYTKTINQMVG